MYLPSINDDTYKTRSISITKTPQNPEEAGRNHTNRWPHQMTKTGPVPKSWVARDHCKLTMAADGQIQVRINFHSC